MARNTEHVLRDNLRLCALCYVSVCMGVLAGMNHCSLIIVACHFTYVVAVPASYAATAAEYKKTFGDESLLDASVRQITITQIKAEEVLAPNFGRHDMIMCLLRNQVPVEWILHAYPYSTQYIQQHLIVGGAFCDAYYAMEQEHVQLIQHEPEAYPPFNGWYHPSPTDLVRVCHLMSLEDPK